MPDALVFISYSRTETAFVDKLEADLKAHNYRTWVDRGRLEGGEDWLKKIEDAIKVCDVMVVVLSREAVQSKYVKKEYTYALDRDKVIIPLLYQSYEVPLAFSDIQRINFEGRYEEGLKELLSALGSHIKASGVAQQPPSSKKQKKGAQNPKPIKPGPSPLQQPQASVPQSPPQQPQASVFESPFWQKKLSEQKEKEGETPQGRRANFRETPLPDFTSRYTPLGETRVTRVAKYLASSQQMPVLPRRFTNSPLISPSGTPARGNVKRIHTRGDFIDEGTGGVDLRHTQSLYGYGCLYYSAVWVSLWVS